MEVEWFLWCYFGFVRLIKWFFLYGRIMQVPRNMALVNWKLFRILLIWWKTADTRFFQHKKSNTCAYFNMTSQLWGQIGITFVHVMLYKKIHFFQGRIMMVPRSMALFRIFLFLWKQIFQPKNHFPSNCWRSLPNYPYSWYCLSPMEIPRSQFPGGYFWGRVWRRKKIVLQGDDQ